MSSSKNGGFYQFGSFAVDASKRRLTRDGESLRLNPKAFDLLVALLERHGEVATKDELLARVWESQFVEEGNLTVHIAAIRKALGEKRNGTRFIATVPGRGYQFVGEISQGHTTLVEERSVSRITIETETDEAGDEASGQKYLSSGSTRSRYPILAVVMAMVVIPLLIYAFYVGPGRRGTSTVNATSERNSRQLSTTGNVSTAAISHDGRYFVYKTFQNGKYAIWYGSTSGGSPVQVKTPDDPNYEGLTFSAAGDAIIYAFNGNLFKIPVLGGPPQMLLAHVSHGFSLSRDDKSVVYTTSDPSRGLSLLISADLETGERKELATLPNDRGFGNYPALSPDGKTVAVGVTDRKGSTQAVLVGVDVATGKMTVLDQQEWDIIGKTAWLPDGSAILFNTVGSKSDFHIWMLNNASGELHCVTDDLSRYGRASLTMTDDGTKLLAVRGNLNSNIWIAGPGDLKHLDK